MHVVPVVFGVTSLGRSLWTWKVLLTARGRGWVKPRDRQTLGKKCEETNGLKRGGLVNMKVVWDEAECVGEDLRTWTVRCGLVFLVARQ